MKIGNLEQHTSWSSAHMQLERLFLVVFMFLGLGIQANAGPLPVSASEAEKRTDEEERLNRAVASSINSLGVFLYESGRLDEAEVQFREALRYSADDERTRNNLAMVLLGQSRFRAIIELYPEASADDISDLPLLTALAISHYATGEFEKAVPFFERLHDEKKTKPELEIMLAVALDLNGEETKSKEVLERVGTSAQVEAGYHVFKGDALRDRGQIQEAIVEYEQALIIESELPRVPYRLGVLYSDTHRYEDALRAFERELAINPTNVDAAYSIGAYYLIWGQDLTKARQFFRRSINLDSENISGYLGLMKVCLAEENPDEALELAKEAEGLGLEHPELFYLKARAFRLKGEEELAKEALLRFEELRDSNKEREGVKP
ncbi:MAG: tetratricopeptide repeat protein [bacterium]